MSPTASFVGSLTLAFGGLICSAIALIRIATTATEDAAGIRAHRRWMIIGIASLFVLLAGTALFLYVWFSCAGEC